jgi:hypothetical protein
MWRNSSSSAARTPGGIEPDPVGAWTWSIRRLPVERLWLAVFSVGSTLDSQCFPRSVGAEPSVSLGPYDDTKALVMPATASNGLAITPLVAIASAVNFLFTLTFEE